MTKRQIDRLLISAVAEALGLVPATPPADRQGDVKTSQGRPDTAQVLQTA